MSQNTDGHSPLNEKITGERTKKKKYLYLDKFEEFKLVNASEITALKSRVKRHGVYFLITALLISGLIVELLLH